MRMEKIIQTIIVYLLLPTALRQCHTKASEKNENLCDERIYSRFL